MALNRIQDLGQLNSALSQVDGLAESRFGGRKFIVAGEKVSLNDIIKKIEELNRGMSNGNRNSVAVREQAVRHVVRLDSIKERGILTKIKQFFGRIFFNRESKLSSLIDKPNIPNERSVEGIGYGKYTLTEWKEEAEIREKLRQFEIKYENYIPKGDGAHKIENYHELYAVVLGDKNEHLAFIEYVMVSFNDRYQRLTGQEDSDTKIENLIKTIKDFLDLNRTSDTILARDVNSLAKNHLDEALYNQVMSPID